MYIIIYDQPVYITWEKRQKLYQNTTLSADERAVMNIRIDGMDNEKLKKQFGAESYDYLKSQYEENPLDFMDKWVHFNFSSKRDIDKYLMGIIHDYCHYYGHARASYFDESVSIHSIHKLNLLDKLKKRSPNKLLFKFDLEEIVRVSGNLGQFFIEFRGGTQLYMREYIYMSLIRVKD